MAGDLDDYIHAMENSYDINFYKRKIENKKNFLGYIESRDSLESIVFEEMAQDIANIVSKPVRLHVREVHSDILVKDTILEQVVAKDSIGSILQLNDTIHIGMENSRDFFGANGTGKLFLELKDILPQYEIYVEEQSPLLISKFPNKGPLSKKYTVAIDKENIARLLSKPLWTKTPEYENGKFLIKYFNHNVSDKKLRKLEQKLQDLIREPFELIREQPDSDFVLSKINSTIPKGVIIKDLDYYELNRYCTFLVRFDNKTTFKRWRRRLNRSLNIDIFYKTNWLSDKLMKLGNGTGILRKASQFNSHIKRILKEKEIDFDRKNIIPKKSRVDYTNLLSFTIDPEGSKDFDDAISLEFDGNNYRLGVHIADVTSMFDHNSELDIYARKRIETIYGASDTLTMLPRDLSYLDMSLNPGEVKDTFSIFFTLNNLMKVTGYNIERTQIESKSAIPYPLADQILGGREHEFSDQINMLSRVASGLNDQRREEYNVIFDKKSAMKNAIMECMLLANKTVAMHLENFHVDFPFRVHQSPDEDMKQKIVNKINGIGIKVDMNNLEEKNLREYLRELQKRNPLIASIIIDEFVGRAYYSLENHGHFSLGFKSYTHFTSPIRRYADILVHRQLSGHLHGTKLISKSELKEIIADQNKNYSMVEEKHSELYFYDQVKSYLSKIDKPMNARIKEITHDSVLLYCPDIDSNGVLNLTDRQKIVEHKNENYYLWGNGKKFYRGHKMKPKLIGFSLIHELPCFSFEND